MDIIISHYLRGKNENTRCTHYQGELGDLKDGLVENVGNDTIYFVATPIEQNNNSIRKQQIKREFDKYMKEKDGHRY